MSTWREKSAEVISEVIQQVGLSDPKALRTALRVAYPFGERKYTPYKIWCSEVNRQTKGMLSASLKATQRYSNIHTLKAQGLGDHAIAQNLGLKVQVVRRHLAVKQECNLDLFAGG